jgi:hypothetical protein
VLVCPLQFRPIYGGVRILEDRFSEERRKLSCETRRSFSAVSHWLTKICRINISDWGGASHAPSMYHASIVDRKHRALTVPKHAKRAMHSSSPVKRLGPAPTDEQATLTTAFAQLDSPPFPSKAVPSKLFFCGHMNGCLLYSLYQHNLYF